MARLTLTEAARVTGVSRTTLYRMMADGRLSRNPDDTFDTAELLRAGLTLQAGTSTETPQDDTVEHDGTSQEPLTEASSIAYLERLITNLERTIANLERSNATLERELEAGKAREMALLALLQAQQETQQRLLAQGRSQSWMERLLATFRTPQRPDGTS